MKKRLPIIITSIIIVLIVSQMMMNSKITSQNDVLLSKVRDLEVQIEELEVNNYTVEGNKSVDYERIEQIIEEKMEKLDKSFEDKFEDASAYFGGKIMETFDDISEAVR